MDLKNNEKFSLRKIAWVSEWDLFPKLNNLMIQILLKNQLESTSGLLAAVMTHRLDVTLR